MNASQGKLDYLNEGVKLLCELDNPMERELYASKLSDETGVSRDSILEQVRIGVKRKEKGRRKQQFSQMQRRLSGRDDSVNPQRADHPRVTSAEENLITYLVRNPDKLTYIHERVSPDDFSTDFNRKLYAYFSDKILNNLDPMTTVSADFSSKESSRIFYIVNARENFANTPQALDEYIGIILKEKAKPSESEIKNSSSDEFTNLFSLMKNDHQ